MSINDIHVWHQRARPHPDHNDLTVQLGCHFEEIMEMCETLYGSNRETERLLVIMEDAARALASHLKSGLGGIEIDNRKEFLDSIADQVVTGIGAAYCAGMNGAEAVRRVNQSNWSKFDDEGYPLFNGQGKIAKGPNYAPPVLEGLY